jgi:eukaryotic-like serine/threonine-protein kinase
LLLNNVTTMATITKLGKYLIRRKLGKGAMGVVYEGFDPVLARAVAIKTILPAQLDSSEVVSVLARFKREAQAAGRLNHPGIVAVYEYGEVNAEDDHTMLGYSSRLPLEPERVAFIAMEFVKGRELRSYFEGEERFALKDVGRIMEEILDALGHAHGKGVTHRDIKPANLIMLDDGRVKIADFGIARIESSQLTVAGTVMGTPSYMSPEQFQGQTVDLRSDLFSCGIILYQFLTGEKPFVGTLTSIMFKVLREDPLPPSALNAALAPAWDLLVAKAIAKNPDDRFQSAQAFAAAIREVLASQVPFTPPASRDVSKALAKPKALSEAVKPPQALATPKATLLVWSTVGFLLLVGAGAYLWTGSGTSSVSRPSASSPSLELPSPAWTAPAPLPAPAAATAPAPQPAPVLDPPQPVQNPPAATEPVKRPARKPLVAPPAPARAAQPKPEIERAPVERPPARSQRCALILQKAAVNEPISAEERNFLTSSCQ